MAKWRYGVIFDAGSSGTRAHVYRWLKPGKAREKADAVALAKLPVLSTKKKWTLKKHPGVSTFGETPELVGEKHLKELVAHVQSVVPKDDVKDTPIFLLATAGMRLLPEHQRKAVLANICSYLQMTTEFQLPECDVHIQVIPGATEGLYGWIAANYLLGGFDDPTAHNHGKGHHTYGFLDMGGASAQIAFAPNATVAETHANDLTLLRLRTVGGQAQEYRVFVTTWLGYGVNEARRRYLGNLLEASPGSKEVPDPCLPTGLVQTQDGKVLPPGTVIKETPHLLGTGKFTECLRQSFTLLGKDTPCLDKPCLFNGVHVPPVDLDVNHFVGVSEYWHTTRTVLEAGHKDVAYDFKTYQARVDEFCSQSWKDIQSGVKASKWGKKTDEATAAEVCFKASWLINVLHDGIGIPRNGLEVTKGEGDINNGTKDALQSAKDRGFLDPFQAVDKIEGTEVSWTLGKMVLYAASQHPADKDVMAVGFGSNIVGNKLPDDFQFPSGKSRPLPDAADDLDWHDKLFNSASSRRLPGFIFFFLIVIVAMFLLCGKQRRQSLLTRIVGAPPSRFDRRKRGILSRLLPRNQKYDRVTGDLDDFELGDIASDSDSDIDAGLEHKANSSSSRASGWASPKVVDTPSLQSPKLGKSYFEGPAAQAGVISRTESRERLAPSTGLPSTSGSRSRHASPVRRSSPLTTFKDNFGRSP